MKNHVARKEEKSSVFVPPKEERPDEVPSKLACIIMMAVKKEIDERIKTDNPIMITIDKKTFAVGFRNVYWNIVAKAVEKTIRELSNTMKEVNKKPSVFRRAVNSIFPKKIKGV